MGSSLSKKTFLEYVNLDHSWETEDKSEEKKLLALQETEEKLIEQSMRQVR